MGNISEPTPVKLFVGMLSRDVSLFASLTKQLVSLFGNIDLESPVWPWEHTTYYENEMGKGLKRKFIFFEKLINPETIVDIKIKTNEIERQFVNPPSPPFTKGGMGGCEGGRRINLDPGYLDSSKLVLVTTKNYAHRMYLGKGIYGEVTLAYAENDYQPLPYTYPDYRSPQYIEVFKSARKIIMAQSC